MRKDGFMVPPFLSAITTSRGVFLRKQKLTDAVLEYTVLCEICDSIWINQNAYLKHAKEDHSNGSPVSSSG